VRRDIAEIATLSFTDLSGFLSEVTIKLQQAINVTTNLIEKRDKGDNLFDCEQELRESVEKLLLKIASIDCTIKP